ncbi:hypothetical protein [Amycolatopsis sp. NBC_01286]|uniref:hypothetical protein n=1 Tax=Amycolatopsis sp. NBC_01286 TaxID=2903560 RepID=UPI002E12A6B9|nr:hypothetical protein OG570_43710 [Amycolatopsis sp. NBC_01286]
MASRSFASDRACGRRTSPRSMSRNVRTLTPASPASSCWLIPARRRYASSRSPSVIGPLASLPLFLPIVAGFCRSDR